MKGICIMETAARIIEFPELKMEKHVSRRKPKPMPDIKYYSDLQIKLLRRSVRERAETALERGKVTGVREWMAIDLLTSTGLRVSETANIRCGDIMTGYGESELFVRDGKGSKSRAVQIPEHLKTHLRSFLKWKQGQGEGTDKDDHLFMGQRGNWTSQAVQQVVKKYLKVLGLYKNGKSVHALRHSYAVQYYHKNRDLRGLQKQLGHSSIQTTTIYADVTKEDIQENIKSLWS